MSDEKTTQDTGGPFDLFNDAVASLVSLFGFGDEPETEAAPIDGSGAIDVEGVEVDAAGQ